MKKLNKWFAEVFLESFDEGEYHAQDGWLKPWQYKGLMNLVEVNHWKMLSSKQWDIFRKYAPWETATYEEFANFETETKVVKISVSRSTGFVTINIYEKKISVIE